MNKYRRKSLQDIVDQLEELKGSIEDLQSRDNTPENLQGSEQYDLADAVSSLEDAISSIEAAME